MLWLYWTASLCINYSNLRIVKRFCKVILYNLVISESRKLPHMAFTPAPVPKSGGKSKVGWGGYLRRSGGLGNDILSSSHRTQENPENIGLLLELQRETHSKPSMLMMLHVSIIHHVRRKGVCRHSLKKLEIGNWLCHCGCCYPFLLIKKINQDVCMFYISNKYCTLIHIKTMYTEIQVSMVLL